MTRRRPRHQRASKRIRRPVRNVPAGVQAFTCDCGKRAYVSRKDAKRAAEEIERSGGGSAYRCPHNDSAWHWGHLPPWVKSGELPRSPAAPRRPEEPR